MMSLLTPPMQPLPRQQQLPLLRMAKEEEEEVPAPLRTGLRRGATVFAAVYTNHRSRGGGAVHLSVIICIPRRCATRLKSTLISDSTQLGTIAIHFLWYWLSHIEKRQSHP